MESDALEVPMGLIAGAGDSRSYCMEAVDLAKEGKFDEAREALNNASSSMAATHEVQTQLIRDEMTGKQTPVTLLMAHAQDHLTLALISRDIAEEFINVYEKLKSLEEK